MKNVDPVMHQVGWDAPNAVGVAQCLAPHVTVASKLCALDAAAAGGSMRERIHHLVKPVAETEESVARNAPDVARLNVRHAGRQGLWPVGRVPDRDGCPRSPILMYRPAWRLTWTGQNCRNL